MGRVAEHTLIAIGEEPCYLPRPPRPLVPPLPLLRDMPAREAADRDMLGRLVGVRSVLDSSSNDDEPDFFVVELPVGWVETGCICTGAGGRPATGLVDGTPGRVPCPGR